MKITKKFITVFIATFVIGFVAVLPTKKVSVEQELSEVKPMLTVATKIELKEELEILEENNDWRDEDQSKFKIKLLETGEGFHGDEVKAKSGETWLGFFKENDKYFLRNSKIKIRRVHDPVIDGYYEQEAAQKTGKSVSVDNRNLSLFLLKSANILNEGEILTLFGGSFNENEAEENIDYVPLKNGLVKEYEIQGQKFSLKVQTAKNKNGEKILALVLESEDIKQVLHSAKYFGEDDYLGTLYWTGDLDRDGKPDFYFDLYFHDNVIYKNLYLSSKASKRKLVKKVATFTITGC